MFCNEMNKISQKREWSSAHSSLFCNLTKIDLQKLIKASKILEDYSWEAI